MFDWTSLCDYRDGYPIAIHRNIISGFIWEEADGGVKTRRGKVIPPAEIVLEVLVWEGSRPIIMSIFFLINIAHRGGVKWRPINQRRATYMRWIPEFGSRRSNKGSSGGDL